MISCLRRILNSSIIPGCVASSLFKSVLPKGVKSGSRRNVDVCLSRFVASPTVS